ncbi:MAG: SOS response-associated peptidase [Methanoregula sp.]|nr:SOS response-associated peptidase [Methanoregula sp.]
MCRRYALKCIDMKGQTRLVVDADIWFPSHFNIAPASKNPVIIATPTGNRLRIMQWGLRPHGAPQHRAASRVANARAESIVEKPMFCGLVADRRCVVPASGFYEWKNEGSRKVPFYIRRRDHALLLLAGLYDTGQDPAGEPQEAYTIITTEPNELMAPVHDRMPAILTEEGVQRWLSAGPLSPEALREILSPCAPDLIEANPVSSRVNNAAEDDEQLIAPVRGLF